jgi:hypothetical protein
MPLVVIGEGIVFMQIIRLSRHLDDLDLETLNRRIHAGEIGLDWRAVAPDIPPATLQQVLAGLNLAEHIDAIGSDTIPELLYPIILAILDASEPPAISDEQPGSAGSTQVAPALWFPQEQAEDSESEQTIALPALQAQKPVAESTTTTPIQPLLAAPSPAQMRAELQEMVVRDLLGPAGGEDEEVDEARVRDRYLVGMLAPNKTQTHPEELDGLGDVETAAPDEGAQDKDTIQKPTFNPASLGMSFSVDNEASTLLVTARWGHYQRADSASIKTAKGAPKKVWRRTIPHSLARRPYRTLAA